MKDQKSSWSHDRRLILSLPVCLFVTSTAQHASRSMCAALVVFVWLVWPVRLPCILLSTTSQKHHFILWLCVCHPRILNDECGRGTVWLSPPSRCSGLPSPPVSLLFLSPKCCLGEFEEIPYLPGYGAYHGLWAHRKLRSLLSEEAERRIAAPRFVLRPVQEVDFFLNLFSVLQ